MRHLLRYSICYLLTIFVALTTGAQEQNAAFYIYQNDGHFDGFFYDQVQKISYSYLDTLGIEHDEVVSQEIVTADSTYRIMLSAIDSVSFVQPEIKFNPNLRMMRDEGMTDYLLSLENMMLVFSTDMPEPLRPKEGQVLALPMPPGTDEPFVGKVVTVYEFEGKLHVACAKVQEMKDIFEQFISVEEIVNDQQGNPVRRRVAGMKPRRAEGNWNGDLFQMNVDLEDSYSLSDKWNLQFALHTGFGMRAQVVYNITLTNFYLKMLFEERLELGLKASIDGTIGERDNILEKGALAKVLLAMSRLHFPAQFPLMYIDVAPKPFVRGEAHFNVGVGLGASTRIFQQWFEIMNKSPYFNFGLINSNKGEWLEPSFNVTAELNGMVQAGVKFPFKIGSEEYISNVLHIVVGNTLYTGPKLTGAISLDVIKAFNGNIYEGFKNSKLTATMYSFDNELKFEAEGLFGKKVTTKLTRSLPFGVVEFGAFPQFSDVKCELTGDTEQDIHATMKLNGEVIIPQRIGFALYDEKDKQLDYKLRDELYLLNTFNSVDVTFKNLQPGVYKVRPITKLFGTWEVPIYPEEKKLSIDSKAIIIFPPSLEFEEEGGTQSAIVYGGIGGDMECETEQAWIHPTMIQPTATLSVEVDPNGTNQYRQGKIVVREKISDLEEMTDTLIVKQYGGITISKSELEFSEDGGTEVLTVKTNLDRVQANISEDTDPMSKWLFVELAGEALTVRADPNTSGERSATVTLAAPNKAGDGIVTSYLKVNQKSLLNLPVDTIRFDRLGKIVNSQPAFIIEDEMTNLITVKVTTPLPTLIVEDEVSWLTVGNYDNTSFWVEPKRNYQEEERMTTIAITVTDNVKYATKRIVVLQEGEPNYGFPFISTEYNSVKIPAEGGKVPLEVHTNMSGISITLGDDADWIGSVQYHPDDEECVFYADHNSTDKERKGKVTLTVRNGEYESSEIVTVTQPPYQRIVEYDGVAVTFRYNGDMTDELMDRNGAYSVTRPVAWGVSGSGSAGTNGASIISTGYDPTYGSWDIQIVTSNGYMFGSVRWTNSQSSEGYRFNISGAPVGNSGPLNHNGAFRGDKYWNGDAAFCYPPLEQWGSTTLDGRTYISGFEHWWVIKDDEGNTNTYSESYNDRPVEIDIFLHSPFPGGTQPYSPK